MKTYIFITLVTIMSATIMADTTICPEYADKTADVLACLKAKQAPKYINPCIVTTLSGFEDDIDTYEKNNGFYPGSVNKTTYTGDGMAFSWVKSSGSLQKYLNLIANSNNDGITDPLKNIFIDIGYGHDSNLINNNNYSLYFMDTCNLEKNQGLILNVPTITFWLRWIEKNIKLQNENGKKFLFSLETIDVLTESFATNTPFESYQDLTGCDPKNDDFIRDNNATWSSGCPNMNQIVKQVYELTIDYGVFSNTPNTVKCFEKALKNYNSLNNIESVSLLRAALDMCLDVNKYNSANGMGWDHYQSNDKEEQNYTSPEWVITNYKTIQQMKAEKKTNGFLENVIFSCDVNSNCNMSL